MCKLLNIYIRTYVSYARLHFNVRIKYLIVMIVKTYKIFDRYDR